MSTTPGERMLELLALLQARQRWSGDDLAARLGVSERTLRRDVDRLRLLGYPVHASRGVDGGYQLGSGRTLPPLLVSDDEAVAVAVGLRVAAAQPFAGISDASMSALAKLGQVLPKRLQGRVESLAEAMGTLLVASTGAVPIEVLTVLAMACRDREVVRFGYRSPASDHTDRHVEPHHVVPLSGRWYLIAWDLDRDDWRTFRLDRVSNPRGTHRLFDPRELPAEDPASHLRNTLNELRSVHQVELVVEVPLAEVQPHLGAWGSATSEGPGATRIEMRIPDLGWAVLMLAILDAEIRSVEPPALQTFLGTLAGRFSVVPGVASSPSG